MTAVYRAVGTEVEIFTAAARAGLPVMLKGPTGTGKTTFVEHMARTLKRPLVTVACHEDLTAADLVGRHLLDGDSTVWSDGPLTRAVREGAICYLDEVVEARQDVVVVLHPVADHRRELHIDRLSETLHASDEFMLVVSYNPEYQHAMKDLKDSTRQRMIAIELGFPSAEIECAIVRDEGTVDIDTARTLVALGSAIRKTAADHLSEVASTRTLVSAAKLIAGGIQPTHAARAAISGPLTDDPDVSASLGVLIDAYLGRTSNQ